MEGINIYWCLLKLTKDSHIKKSWHKGLPHVSFLFTSTCFTPQKLSRFTVSLYGVVKARAKQRHSGGCPMKTKTQSNTLVLFRGGKQTLVILNLFTKIFLVSHQLNDGHGGGITLSHTCFDDASVSTIPIGVLITNFVKQFGHNFFTCYIS